MAEGKPLFTVGPAPHRRSGRSLTQLNYAFLLTLFPAAFVGAVAYGFGPEAAVSVGAGTDFYSRALRFLIRELGLRANVLSMAGALGVLFLSMGSAMLAEYVIQVAFRQPYRAFNGHAALIGLILGMLMPATVPWWVVVIGAVVAVLVGKQIYGGIGGYPFHPALVGWLILLLSWQNHIYPVGLNSIGTSHWVVIFFILLGGLALVALGYARWEAPFGVIAGVALSGLVFYLVYPDKVADPLTQLMTGNVMLAAFYIATDPTSSPANRVSLLIFGLGAGALIMLIRVYGIWPDAVPFAILLMNILSPLLDKIRPRAREVLADV